MIGLWKCKRAGCCREPRIARCPIDEGILSSFRQLMNNPSVIQLLCTLTVSKSGKQKGAPVDPAIERLDDW